MRHHAKFRQNRSNACGYISRLTANNRDQLQNLTLGNRVGPYGLLFSVLFCSLAVLDMRVGLIMDLKTFSIYPCSLSL